MSGAGVGDPRSRAGGEAVTGVCHLTATARAGVDVDHMVVRLVMTEDVLSEVRSTHYALGPDQACRELRRWMQTMCASRPAD